jgi:hypothetical protein
VRQEDQSADGKLSECGGGHALMTITPFSSLMLSMSSWMSVLPSSLKWNSSDFQIAMLSLDRFQFMDHLRDFRMVSQRSCRGIFVS